MRAENNVTKPIGHAFKWLVNREESNRIAFPYYGDMVRPGAGIEKLYFIADVDLRTFALKKVCLDVWNSRSVPELPGWLKNKGVDGLVCRDECKSYIKSFERAGIWVLLDKALDMRWLESLAAQTAGA